MNFPATFRGNFVPISQCSSCCDFRFRPYFACSTGSRRKRCRFSTLKSYQVSRLRPCGKREIACRVTDSETQTDPDGNDDKEKELQKDGEKSPSTSSFVQNDPQLDSQPINGEKINNSDEENQAQGGVQDVDSVEIASGSPLPGVKVIVMSTPQQLDESIRISKETIEILKNQVFGFDTFFITSQDPYEGGVLFKGNLRGQAAKSYEKIRQRMQDDKPVAVVVPRMTLQPETTAVPEWFAAGAFGLVTVFTLLLRNVPALQSNLLSTFDNLDLLKDGLPGALVTALVLAVHEVSHILVANSTGIKLGVPYFVPSWQIGSFGAITRIVNIVSKREDLLKVAIAGPLAGFSLGLVLLLLGFILPPTDGLGVVVDASVFHESLLAGGIAKLLLGNVLKEGTPISVNPLVLWAWAGLLINAINSIPAGELDGGRISFAIWGRKRGPIAPLSEEVTDPDGKYVALGVLVLFLGLLIEARKDLVSVTGIKIDLGPAYGRRQAFFLINPEDDKPVAVVVPRMTLQPETTAVPEWFAAGAFGLVTVFTLLLRNVPALQSNLLSTFDNLDLLKDGLPGALVTALVLAVHEVSHILVANSTGIKLGVPYFVPSWQIGSFGAITRIVNIVSKREDLLKVAIAGPLAGFSLGLVLLLLGFILPPTDGLGVVVDASVFHESLLAGGIAKLLLGNVLKEGTPISVNPLVLWAWAGLLINAINSIPAGELDGGRISFAIWGRKASSRFTAASIVLLGLSSLFNDVAFYWVVLIFFLQRGPIAPLSEEVTDPDGKYVALGVLVLFLGLLVCLPYPFPFTDEVITSF
ncbi:putative zinc metalloprotease egy2 [Quercus suber]|uniref:Zinc metalloprotease egy2 n=1 Tax=Quercus suber TaxID=58331 RepID=A0AAW0L7K3_QUESU